MARRAIEQERDPNNQPYLGTLIRESRKEKYPRLDDLAKIVHLHPASLSKIETNEAMPSIQALTRIAEATEKPLEDFLQAPVHPILEATKQRRSMRLAIERASQHGYTVKQTIGSQIDQIIVTARFSSAEYESLGFMLSGITRTLVLELSNKARQANQEQ